MSGRDYGQLAQRPKAQPDDPKVTGTAVSTDTKSILGDIKARVEEIAKAEAKAKNPEADTPYMTQLREGLRVQFGSTQGECRVVTNYLRLDLPAKIYVYKVKMIREYHSGKPVLVRKFDDRQKIMPLITEHVHQLQTSKGWVTDGDLIWSTTKLFDPEEPCEQAVARLKHGSHGASFSYYNECGKQLQVAEVEIYYKHKFNPTQKPGQLFKDPGAVAQRRSEPGILLRGLNAFLSAHARKQTREYTFTSGNKCYSRGTEPQASLSSNPDGGCALRALRGFFLSARPGVERLLINVNVISSAFFGNQKVDAFLRTSPYSRRSPTRQTALLNGVNVKIEFGQPTKWDPPESAHRFILEIGEDVDRQLCHGNVTVKDCFEGNDKGCAKRLMTPSPRFRVQQCRAVLVGRSALRSVIAGEEEWYPAACLSIEKDQPFHSALTAGQTSKMITFAQQDPLTSYRSIIKDGLEMFGFNAVDQGGLQSFSAELKAGDTMLSVPASWLNAPEVKFKNGPRNVDNASWNLAGVKFADTSKTLQALPWLNLSHFKRDQAPLSTILKVLHTALGVHGLIPQKSTIEFSEKKDDSGVSISNADPSPEFDAKIMKVLQHAQPEDKFTPLLVTIDHADHDLYSYIKRVAELKLGIPTIFMKTLTKDKHNNDQPINANAQLGSNVALKYNIKLQQANWTLGETFKKKYLYAQAGDRKGKCNTIVIGADVTHPGLGSAEGTPSIAAVVGSTDDDFMHFPGSMRLQRSRKEYIIELGDMVKERLLDWAAKHDNLLPERMLFYRDGVSESQYAKLRSFEIPQLSQAYNWAQAYLDRTSSGGHKTGGKGGGKGGKGGKGGQGSKGGAAPKSGGAAGNSDVWPTVTNTGPRQEGEEDAFNDPKLNVIFDLTYVVVGKRHNTRFYAAKDTDKIQNEKGVVVNHNVKPGLVVDQVITHPHNIDFYLQSHQPIKGTGRSAHYFVLQNYMELSTNDLQAITHAFCYTYSRATKGVSYCAPAYYADRLCDRGRAYLRHWLTAEDYDDYKPPTKTQRETYQYHDHIKDQLRDSRYWRSYALDNPNARKYGSPRRNPWHPNMDDIMFYL